MANEMVGVIANLIDAVKKRFEHSEKEIANLIDAVKKRFDHTEKEIVEAFRQRDQVILSLTQEVTELKKAVKDIQDTRTDEILLKEK